MHAETHEQTRTHKHPHSNCPSAALPLVFCLGWDRAEMCERAHISNVV